MGLQKNRYKVRKCVIKLVWAAWSSNLILDKSASCLEDETSGEELLTSGSLGGSVYTHRGSLGKACPCSCCNSSVYNSE